jgi:hypothetical protein
MNPPPRRLGRLEATADSFLFPLTMSVYGKFSWGRDAGNTVTYRNDSDVRIAKTAFELLWYSSSNRVYNGIANNEKDLKVTIRTHATYGILVNGNRLRRCDKHGRILYGNLHTGDIIEVYSSYCQKERLRFKCEFYAGSARHPRSSVGDFQIHSSPSVVTTQEFNARRNEIGLGCELPLAKIVVFEASDEPGTK